MANVVVIADPVTAEAFLMTDFSTRAAFSGEEAVTHIRQALRDQREIIFVTENLVEGQLDTLQQLQKESRAIITVIPGVGTSIHLGEKMLELLKKSVIGI
ncbi:MAG: hypothetical protein D6814_11415 [Calditrichaeota bacterium]|nr:MAG: hypothetical protein D6814_11415 [Calditrichota bacterium]